MIPQKLAFVSPGNLGVPLIRALQKEQISVSYIYTRNPKQLAEYDFGEAIITQNLDELRAKDLLIFITLPDATLKQAKDILSPLQNEALVHTSGSTSIEVLLNLTSKAGVFYPFQTFKKDAEPRFKDVPIFIEGNEELSNQLALLADKLNAKKYFIDSTQRLQLHLSGVIVNNFTNYLLSWADEICATHNLKREWLIPLILKTAKNYEKQLAKSSQTGPAVRGDQPTLAKHLELLENKPKHQKLYSLLTQLIQEKHHV